MDKTSNAFCIFFLAPVLACGALGAEADDGVRISLGQSTLNSHVGVAELSYEWHGWELAVSGMEQGRTTFGEQDGVEMVSFSHLFRPRWSFLGGRNYFRLGAAYVDGSPLVGNTNFRLGIGMEFELLAVEVFHYSSAGIHYPNNGLDGILLRLKLSSLFGF